LGEQEIDQQKARQETEERNAAQKPQKERIGEKQKYI
jgi:hypothetical protein